MKKILLTLIAVVGLAAPIAIGAAQGDVIINEIAWMGSTNFANDEWIELKNTTTQSINLTGWTLASADKKLTIPLKGTLRPEGFYLLERTDNNSVPNINADVIYKGSLPNTGINLILYNSTKTTIDTADFSSGWIIGNNTTKQTAEKSDGGWQTSQEANGTPGAQNSAGVLIASIQQKPETVLPINQKPDTKEVAAISQSEKTLVVDQNTTNP